jgi:hypothetical protein
MWGGGLNHGTPVSMVMVQCSLWMMWWWWLHYADVRIMPMFAVVA